MFINLSLDICIWMYFLPLKIFLYLSELFMLFKNGFKSNLNPFNLNLTMELGTQRIQGDCVSLGSVLKAFNLGNNLLHDLLNVFFQFLY